MALLVLLALMILLAILAPRYGVDSRDLDRNPDRPTWIGTPERKTRTRA
jgi:hypothetical protein